MSAGFKKSSENSEWSCRQAKTLSEAEYDVIAEETMENLTALFEALPDAVVCHHDYDATYSQGVLKVLIGGGGGTYVINKQSPNRQIWLSSPVSGPKRYDYTEERKWVYSHDGVCLQDLLSEEFSERYNGAALDFSKIVDSK